MEFSTIILSIAGLLSSGANEDISTDEDLTEVSATATTIADTSDSIEISDITFNSIDKNNKKVKSTKMDSSHLNYSSTFTSMSSDTSNDAPSQHHFEKSHVPHRLFFKPINKTAQTKSLNAKNKDEVKKEQHKSNSVSTGVSPIMTKATTAAKNNENISRDCLIKKSANRARLVRQDPLMEESPTSRSESPQLSTPLPSDSTSSSSGLSSSSDITDSMSLDSLDIEQRGKRCLVTNL